MTATRGHRFWERCGPWEVVGSSYQPPTPIQFSGGYLPPGLLERAQMGSTTVTERCQVCGRVSVTEHLGRAVLDA